MHCTTCGKLIQPEDAFCCGCGTPVPAPAPAVSYAPPVAPAPVCAPAPAPVIAPAAAPAPVGKKSPVIAVFLTLLALVMLITMLLMPMMKLCRESKSSSWNDNEDKWCSPISLLDVEFSGEEESDDAAYCSVVTFVLLNASIIGVAVFSFMGKNLISAILSLFKFVVLIWYWLNIASVWRDMAPKNYECYTELDWGMILCLVCVAVSTLLSILEYSAEKKRA